MAVDIRYFPNDIWRHIFSFVDDPDIVNICIAIPPAYQAIDASHAARLCCKEVSSTNAKQFYSVISNCAQNLTGVDLSNCSHDICSSSQLTNLLERTLILKRLKIVNSRVSMSNLCEAIKHCVMLSELSYSINLDDVASYSDEAWNVLRLPNSVSNTLEKLYIELEWSGNDVGHQVLHKKWLGFATDCHNLTELFVHTSGVPISGTTAETNENDVWPKLNRVTLTTVVWKVQKLLSALSKEHTLFATCAQRIQGYSVPKRCRTLIINRAGDILNFVPKNSNDHITVQSHQLAIASWDSRRLLKDISAVKQLFVGSEYSNSLVLSNSTLLGTFLTVGITELNLGDVYIDFSTRPFVWIHLSHLSNLKALCVQACAFICNVKSSIALDNLKLLQVSKCPNEQHIQNFTTRNHAIHSMQLPKLESLFVHITSENAKLFSEWTPHLMSLGSLKALHIETYKDDTVVVADLLNACRSIRFFQCDIGSVTQGIFDGLCACDNIRFICARVFRTSGAAEYLADIMANLKTLEEIHVYADGKDGLVELAQADARLKVFSRFEHGSRRCQHYPVGGVTPQCFDYVCSY